MIRFLAACLICVPGFAAALEPVAVAPGLWAIVGPKGQRNSANYGNNATFGLIETSEGAVLVDPGGTYQGAERLHDVVKGLTDQPVTHVINTGGQDHRWLGNGYWRGQGAQIIAAAAAVADQQDRQSMQFTMLSQLVGMALDGTEPAYADVVFDEAHVLELGGLRIEIANPAPAHTPGDAYVWVPERSAVFTGDIVYTERMLGILDFSDSAGWVEAFAAVEALAPAHVIPGHGRPTDLARAKADTGQYLIDLRSAMRTHIDDGGDIIGSVQIDQSRYDYLELSDMLAGRNAQAVFQQMEWE